MLQQGQRRPLNALPPLDLNLRYLLLSMKQLMFLDTHLWHVLFPLPQHILAVTHILQGRFTHSIHLARLLSQLVDPLPSPQTRRRILTIHPPVSLLLFPSVFFVAHV